MSGSTDEGADPEAAHPFLDPGTRAVLGRIAADLAYSYHGTFSPETVDDVVYDSYVMLAATATVTTYLPLLAERFAHDRLRAVARSEGRISGAMPEALFVCTHNAGRSVMAAGFLAHRSRGRVHVRSAGTLPYTAVSPVIVAAMAEAGVAVTDAYPKPLTDDVVRASDVIVTLGCGDVCPIYPGKRYLDWDVDDPEGRPLSEVRAIRNEIERRVADLLDSLLPPT